MNIPKRPTFEEYDREHPQIYEAFDFLAKRKISEGRAYFSARTLFHGLRWDSQVTMGEPFKINNNYIAAYAKKWLDNNPKHATFFKTRSQ